MRKIKKKKKIVSLIFLNLRIKGIKGDVVKVCKFIKG